MIGLHIGEAQRSQSGKDRRDQRRSGSAPDAAAEPDRTAQVNDAVAGDIEDARQVEQRRALQRGDRVFFMANCRRGSKPITVGTTGIRRYREIGVVGFGARSVGEAQARVSTILRPARAN